MLDSEESGASDAEIDNDVEIDFNINNDNQ